MELPLLKILLVYIRDLIAFWTYSPIPFRASLVHRAFTPMSECPKIGFTDIYAFLCCTLEMGSYSAVSKIAWV